jgi:hypothetical protein
MSGRHIWSTLKHIGEAVPKLLLLAGTDRLDRYKASFK